jgi:hypothetical protein
MAVREHGSTVHRLHFRIKVERSETMKYRFLPALLFISLLLVGCFQLWSGFGMVSNTASEAPPVESSDTIMDAQSLIAFLETQGFGVEPQERISQPFFSVEGDVLRVDGEDIQVFVFPDEASATAEAAQVPADGSSFPTIMITWVSEPHFFHTGNLIVLYVGTNADLLSALETVFGPQFAGM